MYNIVYSGIGTRKHIKLDYIMTAFYLYIHVRVHHIQTVKIQGTTTMV